MSELNNDQQLTPVGCQVIVKFFKNSYDNNINQLITRTMGKVGVIDKDYIQSGNEMPCEGEFWKVDIVKETNPGKPYGCFILKPICKVDPSSLFKLLPGMYEEVQSNGSLIIIPKTKGQNAILPIKLKKSFNKFSSIVVALNL